MHTGTRERIVQLRIINEIHAHFAHSPGMTELREHKLGEDLVEAAQILLYRRRTTPRCSLSRHPNTVHTVFEVESRAMRIINLRIIDEIHAHQGCTSSKSKSVERT
jgi:hypothetical protein